MKDIDFTKPQVGVFVGRPKMGKSNAVKYFILKNTINEKNFDFGIVFTRTKFNDGYDYIPDKYIYTEYKPEILQKYMKGLEKIANDGKKIPPNFVIFDDLQGVLNRNDPILTNFVSSHRHYNCKAVFFCFQYLYGASPLLRECATFAVMFRSQGNRTLQGLYENFGQLFDNFEEFKKHFFKITKKKYNGMLYIQDISKKKKNYLRFKAPDMSIFNGITLNY